MAARPGQPDGHIAGPCTLPRYQRNSAVYAIASGGAVCCLNPASGHLNWKMNIGSSSQGTPQLVSSPTLTIDRTEQGERHRIYFGAWFNDPLSSAAAVYCLEDELVEP